MKEYYSKTSTKRLEADLKRLKWVTVFFVVLLVGAIALKTIFTDIYWWEYLSIAIWLPFPIFGLMQYRWIHEELASRELNHLTDGTIA